MLTFQHGNSSLKRSMRPDTVIGIERNFDSTDEPTNATFSISGWTERYCNRMSLFKPNKQIKDDLEKFSVEWKKDIATWSDSEAIKNDIASARSQNRLPEWVDSRLISVASLARCMSKFVVYDKSEMKDLVEEDWQEFSRDPSFVDLTVQFDSQP
ncbi:uncharacterized protein I206_100161 [Kwoniella pini CBS 10737]|uniref:Uncharacterized protein n=1 Tax=Kwoniella pini CBS 10737 TaxID=1296096 RepID=A0A1B9IEY9_9TREE|nr:uncharacterized protein I206_01167 [Kwoniella pini CBS 10737]OCF53860.1 hypothetical protein I206_01167 [Kwoniella pini CBS 10737]